jgi:hypothetical protein
VAAWAYSETGQSSDLCSIAGQQKSLSVITTQETSVRNLIQTACPNLAPRIHYVR